MQTQLERTYTHGLLCLAAIALVTWLTGCPAHAQPTNVTPNQLPGFFAPLLRASNWVAAPYGTYTLKQHPGATARVGGGILAIYNLAATDPTRPIGAAVGTGVGVDWLGGFSLVTGNVELKVPIHPFPNGSWSNFTVVPFGIGGIGTPIAGTGQANGGVATVAGAGVSVPVARVFGGTLSTGAAYIDWQNSGPYSGKSIRPFVAWRKSF